MFLLVRWVSSSPCCCCYWLLECCSQTWWNRHVIDLVHLSCCQTTRCCRVCIVSNRCLMTLSRSPITASTHCKSSNFCQTHESRSFRLTSISSLSYSTKVATFVFNIWINTTQQQQLTEEARDLLHSSKSESPSSLDTITTRATFTFWWVTGSSRLVTWRPPWRSLQLMIQETSSLWQSSS